MDYTERQHLGQMLKQAYRTCHLLKVKRAMVLAELQGDAHQSRDHSIVDCLCTVHIFMMKNQWNIN